MFRRWDGHEGLAVGTCSTADLLDEFAVFDTAIDARISSLVVPYVLGPDAEFRRAGGPQRGRHAGLVSWGRRAARIELGSRTGSCTAATTRRSS
jgi:hypothetical protein